MTIDDNTDSPIDLFEGDIVRDKKLSDRIELMKSGSEDEFALYDAATFGLWPNGVVYYVISPMAESIRPVIQSGMAKISSKSCILFKPRTNQPNYINFVRKQGCYSMIGMQNGPQELSLGYGCEYDFIVAHELLHALGFFHEQSRLDRDQYIIINYNNIMRGMEYNFDKYRPNEATTYGLPYDINSIMHYDSYAFGMQNKPTITNKNGMFIDKKRELSEIDIKQLNIHYSCKGNNVIVPTTTTNFIRRTTRPVIQTTRLVTKITSPTKQPRTTSTSKPTIVSKTKVPITLTPKPTIISRTTRPIRLTSKKPIEKKCQDHLFCSFFMLVIERNNCPMNLIEICPVKCGIC